MINNVFGSNISSVLGGPSISPYVSPVPTVSSPTAQGAVQALLQYLASQTNSSASNFKQLAQTLFLQIDVNGVKTITKADLQQAVVTAGGTKAAANALWNQLDPHGAGSISAQQFDDSKFLSTTVSAIASAVATPKK